MRNQFKFNNKKNITDVVFGSLLFFNLHLFTGQIPNITFAFQNYALSFESEEQVNRY